MRNIPFILCAVLSVGFLYFNEDRRSVAQTPSPTPSMVFNSPANGWVIKIDNAGKVTLNPAISQSEQVVLFSQQVQEYLKINCQE